MEFFADGFLTTIHTTADLDMVDPSNIMRLVNFFSTKLSVISSGRWHRQRTPNEENG